MKQTELTYTLPDLAPELLEGPIWLSKQRQSLRESFNSLPLPRRGLQLWRYTDPSRFMVETASSATSVNGTFEAARSAEQKHLAEGRLAGLVTDITGREIAVHGVDDAAKSGLLVMALSEAAKSHHTLIEPHLYSLVNAQTGKFEAMNGALWQDGVFIHVPDGVVIDKPLHLLRQIGGAGSAAFPRLLVIVGKNAEITLIDEYGGGPADDSAGLAYANGAVEIVADADSRTRYIALQRLAGGTRFYQTHRARIGRGAQMLTIPLAFGGTLSKQPLEYQLQGGPA
ncbi:MAG: SufD family Fe-S cluster assembly protein [candidate division Zixibacteria bacterium]|nr:SufD family Fe-S cluster assembly protein [candidate division Zixibacteria bacterium]